MISKLLTYYGMLSIKNCFKFVLKISEKIRTIKINYIFIDGSINVLLTYENYCISFF